MARRRDETARDRILDAALTLFAAHGYHGVGMDAIAGAAGLAPSSLYNHFKGKRDLFLALMQREMPALPDWPARRDQPLEPFLVEVATATVAMQREKPAFSKLMLFEAIRDPEVGELFYHRLVTVSDALSTALAERAQRGEVRLLSADVAARFLLGAVGWTAMALDSFGGRQIEPVEDARWIAEYVRLFLHGVLPA